MTERIRNRGKLGPSTLSTHGKARISLLETRNRPKTNFSPWPTTRRGWPTSYFPWRPNGWSAYQKKWSAGHLVWQPLDFRHVSPNSALSSIKVPASWFFHFISVLHQNGGIPHRKSHSLDCYFRWLRKVELLGLRLECTIHVKLHSAASSLSPCRGEVLESGNTCL